jgi:lysophospholipase L1-like esterase
MIYERLIICGDSFSEGMSDQVINGKYRGWADRVADVMAQANPNFTYVNLAVRGKLVAQVIADQVPQAEKFITGKNTLVTFHAGANDALRPNYNPELVLPLYTDAVRKLAATGVTLMLFTVLERTGNAGKAADLWAVRFHAFNENVRAVAQEVGAIVADANEESFFNDRRFLAFDRLHLNPMGHDRVAQAVLEKLELPSNPNWRKPLPPTRKTPWVRSKVNNVAWFLTFALPWLWRRARGKSSGDGRIAKYPEPITWPITKS